MDPAFLPVFFLFFVMGFGDLRAAMVGFLPGHYQVSAGAAGLLPFWGTIAFVLFALPISALAARFGLALLLQGGLALVVAGHLLPLAHLSSYPLLLAGTFLAGTGLTAMQVAGPPLLAKLSARPHFARDQVAAQFLQSLGSLAGPALLPALLAWVGPWWTILPVLALIAFGAWTGFWRMLRRRDRCGPGSLPVVFPERAPNPRQPATMRALLEDRGILLPTAGIFLYAGSEAGLATWAATHLAETHGMDLRTGATLWGPGLFFLTLALGRIGGVAVLRVVSGRQLLMVSSGLGVLAILGLMFGGRFLAVAAMVLSGLGFATVWPVLYALTVENRPRQGTQVAGLMAMANCGGALFPPLMGLVADAASLRWAFLLPLAGLAGIGALGAVTQYAPAYLGWSGPAPRGGREA